MRIHKAPSPSPFLRHLPALPAIFAVFMPLAAPAEETAASQNLEVSAQDVVSTRIRHEGDRRITFQKLDPRSMEEKTAATSPPPSPPPIPVGPETGEATAAEKPFRHLCIGASVMSSDEAHPEDAITRLTIWPANGEPKVVLWVNANFLWLSGTPGEIETDHARYSLVMMTSPGSDHVPADLPFPADGQATLVIAEGNPTEEQLAPIDKLLAVYVRDRSLLRENYEKRVREAAALEAARQADPPEKKNIVIRYWQAATPSGKTPKQEEQR